MRKKIPTIDTRPFELFLDLDGVFADFDGHFFKLSGHWPHQVDRHRLWKIINREETFFADLPLMKDAEHLWSYTQQYEPVFLSGLPSRNSAKAQKEEWVARMFGPEWKTIVLPKRDKQLHSGPNKVLLDDNKANLEQWTSKGGHGILHKGDVWESIDKLEELRKAYG